MVNLIRMTNRKKNCLWIRPSLCDCTIILIGGTFRDYGIPLDMYKKLCTHELIIGNLYPFDPESRSKAVAHVEDRGRFTNSDVWNHSPTFSTLRYTGISYFSMTKNVYTFESHDYAKKACKYVENAYTEQLKAYK